MSKTIYDDSMDVEEDPSYEDTLSRIELIEQILKLYKQLDYEGRASLELAIGTSELMYSD